MDRPNLSKDFLAGKAPEDWVFLQPAAFYERRGIRLELGTTATALDAAARRLELADGRSLGFDRLLLATGAEPVRLADPRRRQAARLHPAHARRQPRHHRRRRRGARSRW